MSLNSEMRQLTENLLNAFGERVVAVAGIRSSTARELADFDAVRQQMAAGQRMRLAEHRNGLAKQRDRVASETRAFLQAAETVHHEMAAEQRARLAEHRDGLAKQRDRVASETQSFLQGTEAVHHKMAAEQQARLAAQRDGLAAQRDRVASDTGAFLKAADAAHHEMAAEQQARLAQQGDALRVWTSFAKLMQDRRASGQAAPPPVAPAPPPPATPATGISFRSGGGRTMAPAAPLEGAASDDLTAISGIGVGMKERLNRAGIRSFAQLTQRTPDELRELLGNAGRLAKVELWIEEAQDMMRRA